MHFFNAIVKERWLEFGHEGIRKYDLLRWNLLDSKLKEARATIQKIRDRVDPYTNVPQYIYYKNVGEEIVYYTVADSMGNAKPFWQPTQTPPANTILDKAPTSGAAVTKWLKLDWAQNLTIDANIVDGVKKPLWQIVGYYFKTGKSELFPFDQTTIDSYQGRLAQNPNYP
jgi:hypothetical protein